MASVVSIQVGLPREVPPAGAGDFSQSPWTTGYFKDPVSGPIAVRPTGIVGDGQADLVHHGGPNKAVCVYPLVHYPEWQTLLDQPLAYGAFGENFTVDGLEESDVCIGDTWRVGDTAIVQVSQPRQPCWKLARRWQRKSFALEVQDSCKTGWYFRVLTEGQVQAGARLTLLERPHPRWTVLRANRVMHHKKHDALLAAELAALPELSASWQTRLNRRVKE